MNVPKILVVGSMNVDVFVKGVNRIAEFGESVPCESYGFSSGGKGSNQALAASLLGADVTMVGRVGKDTYGEMLIADLDKGGVRTDYIVTDEKNRTGLALLLLNEDGRYVCYTVPGANDSLCINDVKRALDSDTYDIIIMQLEMPLETAYDICDLARKYKVPVFLDAGPAMNIPLKRLEGLFILSPNEAETEALTGICPDSEQKAVAAAKFLYEEAHPKYVIIKLGSRGALLYNGETSELIPCFKVKAVDTTAAGDTFGAALAIQLCNGVDISSAIHYAHAAAGICVSRMGAQISIPRREEVDEFISRYDDCFCRN